MRRSRKCTHRAGLLSVLILAGCELEEVTILDPPSTLVAEVYLRVNDGVPDAVALVHRSRGTGNSGNAEAIVELKDAEGRSARFRAVDASSCMEGAVPRSFPLACYRLSGKTAELIQPGARLEVVVTPTSGSVLRGETQVPGDFQLRVPDPLLPTCRLSPGELLDVRWSRARGAWAYVPEVIILGLKEAFAPLGVEVYPGPVALQGLSVSEADTSVVLPAGFGVFNRFQGDQGLLLALRDGFPPGGVRGRVTVSAWDRNAVNWNRVGGFNPSGAPRSPSLWGEGGTGVVASVVNRSFGFHVGSPDGGTPCAPGGTPGR
ncbi:MAG: hypothetical protein EA350_03365 [Gemmatimonadales bacterium]|nr:MAG: hypothetical protein EA350_03365 [Gemmatimonadales bacterium]